MSEFERIIRASYTMDELDAIRAWTAAMIAASARVKRTR